MDRTPHCMKPRPRLALRATLTAALVALGGAGALLAQGETRVFRQAFPLTPGAELRLANLAGTVELVRGQEAQVVVEATLHAEGTSSAETRQLLQTTARWVPARDAKGREEWALAYPVEQFHSFYYPRPGRHEEGFWSFFDNGYSSTSYRGEKVRIYKRQRSSAPLLYADLRISVPGGAVLAVRDLVGAVRGGALDGVLSVDTGSGGIELDGFAGRLHLATGSGDIHLGHARGETTIATGSGDLVVRELVGNGKVDTGSGDVVIDKVSAGKLAVDTGSGNVTVRGGVASQLTADTGSGDVHIVNVELEELLADTGSGSVEVVSSLANARRVTIKTGSGDVRLTAGPQASFDVSADQGSGDLTVGYADAVLRRARGRDKVIGARRGEGRTVIHLETGSGDCVIRPAGGRERD